MTLRKATSADSDHIWTILQDAIAQRRAEGSAQWQDGYPNQDTIAGDLAQAYGYVVVENETILAYAAISFDGEPAYENLEGQWLSNQEYVVLHRLATAKEAKGKGVATTVFMLLEELALQQKVCSIKVDTNYDNAPMLHILEKLGYSYCGEVIYRGDYRRAYEKILS